MTQVLQPELVAPPGLGAERPRDAPVVQAFGVQVEEAAPRAQVALAARIVPAHAVAARREQPDELEVRASLAAGFPDAELVETAWLPVRRGEAEQPGELRVPPGSVPGVPSVPDSGMADSAAFDFVEPGCWADRPQPVSHSVLVAALVRLSPVDAQERSAGLASVVPQPRGAQRAHGSRSEAVGLARQGPGVLG